MRYIKYYFFQDQMLTKEEILENWNMFVGSQATNYGEDLTRNHDELWTSRVCGTLPDKLNCFHSLRSHATDWSIAALPHRTLDKEESL